MTTILLAIKPEFADKILSTQKKFEFRRTIPRKPINKIVIYATRPVGHVVGMVNVCRIISGTPDYVWQITQKNAGITQDFFDSYFYGRNTAYAYKLGKVIRYNTAKSLSDFGLRAAPQSFVYLD